MSKVQSSRLPKQPVGCTVGGVLVVRYSVQGLCFGELVDEVFAAASLKTQGFRIWQCRFENRCRLSEELFFFMFSV